MSSAEFPEQTILRRVRRGNILGPLPKRYVKLMRGRWVPLTGYRSTGLAQRRLAAAVVIVESTSQIFTKSAWTCQPKATSDVVARSNGNCPERAIRILICTIAPVRPLLLLCTAIDPSNVARS